MKNYTNLKLSLHQYCIIFYLDKYNGSTRKQIATRLNITPSRIGEVLATLRKKGVVNSVQSKNDRREVFNYLQ